jgi:hypothetical protein
VNSSFALSDFMRSKSIGDFVKALIIETVLQAVSVSALSSIAADALTLSWHPYTLEMGKIQIIYSKNIIKGI